MNAEGGLRPEAILGLGYSVDRLSAKADGQEEITKRPLIREIPTIQRSLPQSRSQVNPTLVAVVHLLGRTNEITTGNTGDTSSNDKALPALLDHDVERLRLSIQTIVPLANQEGFHEVNATIGKILFT